MPKATQKQAKQATEKKDATQKVAPPKKAPKEAPKGSAPVKADSPQVAKGKAPKAPEVVKEAPPQKQKGAQVGPDPAKVGRPVPEKEQPKAAIQAAPKASGVLREVIVGRGPEGLYVGKATETLKAYKAAVLLARGQNIVKAINALEMLKRDQKGLKVSIESKTETFQGRRGDVARVSAVCIAIRA